HTLLRNQHVRVDIVFGALSSRTRLWIDIMGTIFFLFPFALIVLYYSWPYFLASFNIRESSINAGGLSVWPVKLLIPVGFLLLLLQGVSQLIKLFAALRGEASEDALIEHLSRAQEEVKAVLGDRIL
ncbi:MAG: TRAP transporter small permease subunit, partial [Chloroflexota bacterium]|nr:TRAP transporter small permease subunit [Chloroflexota bacterium]